MKAAREDVRNLPVSRVSARTGASGDPGAAIVRRVMDGYEGSLAIRLWNGARVCGSTGAPCTLVFNKPVVLRDLVLHRDLLQLAEHYLCGNIDVEGDMVALFDVTSHLERLDLSWPDRFRLLYLALRLPSRGYGRADDIRRAHWFMRRNSRRSIAHHYDVSNAFYRLWLDPEMVYSCAYYRSETSSLAEAQRDKLDYLCRKLRLRPGQSLLDIGCGWGALALWAARHYGVRVHGITLSEEQFRLARMRVREAGLEDRVRIDLLDYRDLPEDASYDRVVSVGMFEHVGVRNFPRYFGTVRRVLRPGGLFLNHGITSETGWRRSPLTRFMNRYIFPDGELARIGVVVEAMERAGFETLDVENLRPHYALTLRDWVRNLESERERVVRASSDATWRLWRLYMAGCAWYFDEGSVGVHQVLAGPRHQRHPVPLRRDDLYRALPGAA